MMKYLMVIINHCEDDDEFMVFPVSPFGDNPHQSSPCLFTMVCDPPPGDVAFFSRGTSNHFLHPSPDTMPHHTLGVPMCQTGRGVHARRGGLPAAAGTHWAHSSGHQSWVLPTSTSRVLSVTKTWRRMFWVVFLSGDSGSRPAQSFLFALHFYISAVFRCF